MSPRLQTHSQCVAVARSCCWPKVLLAGHTPSLSLTNGSSVFLLHLDIRKRKATRNIETRIRVCTAQVDVYRTVPLKTSASHTPSRRSVQRALCTTRAEFYVLSCQGLTRHISERKTTVQLWEVQLMGCPKGCRCEHV